MMISGKKELEAILSTFGGYNQPKEKLEQWQTPPEIASVMLFEALFRGDIHDKIVFDLGAGTGVLGIGAALLGAKRVICVEVDSEAVLIAKNNLEKIESTYGPLPVEFINTSIEIFEGQGDTTIMNPPFGLEKSSRHADIKFLGKAFSLTNVVYSLHHSSKENRNFFLAKYAQKHNYVAELIGTFKFPLKARHFKHRKPVKIIYVDFFTFTRRV